MADKTHEDWLLNSMKSLLIQVDSNISAEIVTDENAKKTLIVNNVPEEVIDNLVFITNTDQNNNYLYIDNFLVYTNKSPNPTPLPGLNNVVTSVFYNSDITSFLNGNKTHKPFQGVLYQQDCSFRGNTFSEFVDFFSSSIPLSATTIGSIKTYDFIVYPDISTSSLSSISPQQYNSLQSIGNQTNGRRLAQNSSVNILSGSV